MSKVQNRITQLEILRLCSILIMLLFAPFVVKAQSSYEQLEDSISVNCFNCNLAESEQYVYQKGIKADSEFITNTKKFIQKINETYNGDYFKRRKIKRAFSKAIKGLRYSRHKLCKSFYVFTEISDTNLDVFLLYWYYTNKMNEMIVNMGNTLWEDDTF